MRYRLEWNQGSFMSETWNEISTHPQFYVGTVYEFTLIGWCAL